jgi:uncharacterized protein
MISPAPSSPCIKICTIAPATKLCMGCARTVDEITAWGRLSEQERLRIMAELPSRLAGAQTST